MTITLVTTGDTASVAQAITETLPPNAIPPTEDEIALGGPLHWHLPQSLTAPILCIPAAQATEDHPAQTQDKLEQLCQDANTQLVSFHSIADLRSQVKSALAPFTNSEIPPPTEIHQPNIRFPFWWWLLVVSGAYFVFNPLFIYKEISFQLPFMDWRIVQHRSFIPIMVCTFFFIPYSFFIAYTRRHLRPHLTLQSPLTGSYHERWKQLTRLTGLLPLTFLIAPFLIGLLFLFWFFQHGLIWHSKTEVTHSEGWSMLTTYGPFKAFTGGDYFRYGERVRGSPNVIAFWQPWLLAVLALYSSIKLLRLPIPGTLPKLIAQNTRSRPHRFPILLTPFLFCYAAALGILSINPTLIYLGHSPIRLGFQLEHITTTAHIPSQVLYMLLPLLLPALALTRSWSHRVAAFRQQSTKALWTTLTSSPHRRPQLLTILALFTLPFAILTFFTVVYHTQARIVTDTNLPVTPEAIHSQGLGKLFTYAPIDSAFNHPPYRDHDSWGPQAIPFWQPWAYLIFFIIVWKRLLTLPITSRNP